MKKGKRKIKAPSRERMREIAWEAGQKFPPPLTADYIALSMVHPGLGHVHWHIGDRTLAGARMKKEAVSAGARLVVRIHDVTDIIFDGSNSHTWFDIEAGGREGNYYFGNTRPARNYIAEMGLRNPDGSFYALLTSNTAYFGRNRRAGTYSTKGLFVRGMIDMTFPVENIFDAPVYERMNRELAGIERKDPLCIAVLLPGSGREGEAGGLDSFLRNLSAALGKFGVNASMFSPRTVAVKGRGGKAGADRMRRVSGRLRDELTGAHRQAPFDLIHCHDRCSSQAALAASARLKIPLVLSVHSTAYERAGHGDMDDISALICSWEGKAVRGAALVIVPDESARVHVTDVYGASPEKVVVIPDALHEGPPDDSGEPSAIGYRLNLPRDVPVVLFAGEMSHAAGADLLMDALPTVCRNHGTVHFVFAGDGPLKDELEERARRAGISGRCRFIGHVSHRDFRHVLLSSDFVVIPARTWQDEALARMAIEHGRPVLTTRQAGINCVVHGGTGLVTFDNPGSIVWGIQEMLFNPLRDSMLQAAARKSAGRGPSLENAAVQHYMYYEIVLRGRREHA